MEGQLQAARHGHGASAAVFQHAGRSTLLRTAATALRISAAGAEVAALLADRERLTGFLASGLKLHQRALSRKWERPTQGDDPSMGQKSNDLARKELLDSYQWLWMYGPTVMLVLDRALLNAAAWTLAQDQTGYGRDGAGPGAAVPGAEQ